MTEEIALASNIANVVVGLANIVLVLFLFWQISLQKRFYLEQSRRDAAQKIAESYQRLSATFMGDGNLAERFYQTHNPADARMRAAWSFVLSTLHQEYRFASQGLHPLENVRKTAQAYIGFIDSRSVLDDIIVPILKTGYDAGFVTLIEEMVAKRRNTLVTAAQAMV
jgi:hypothetical protein